MSTKVQSRRQPTQDQQTGRLGNYNQTITVEVSVDDIANKLLKTFPEDYAHKEILTEAIISTGLNNNTIGYIYNALNGYSPEIDFEVNQKVICTEQLRRVTKWKTRNEESGCELVSPERISSDRVEIGECTIIAIDPYCSDKLKVRFEEDTYYNYGETEISEAWVNHKNCEKLPNHGVVPVDMP